MKLKNVASYRNLDEQFRKHHKLPTYPEVVYRNKGWISWEHFINSPIHLNIDYLNYGDAEKIVHRLRLKNSEEWKQYADSEERNPRIPKTPWIVYEGKGWASMGKWLGTGFVATRS